MRLKVPQRPETPGVSFAAAVAGSNPAAPMRNPPIGVAEVFLCTIASARWAAPHWGRRSS